MKVGIKKILSLLFHSIIYILALETLITNIVNIFVPSLQVTRGNYYEVTVRSSGNTSQLYTEYLYAIKYNYTIDNCTEPIGPINANNYNYQFLKVPVSLIFFWIGQLIMIVVSSTDMFFFIQEFRRELTEVKKESTSAEKNDGCTKCKSCCKKFLSILMKIGRLVFVSTTYALPGYYMANFNYTTPCLTPYPSLFLGDTGLIFYYVNLSIMVVISVILLRRQIRTGIPETVFEIEGVRTVFEGADTGAVCCAFIRCDRGAVFRVALKQMVIMFVTVGLFGSMVIFITQLASKANSFITSVNGVLRIGLSAFVLLINLHTIGFCDCCR
jgi:hypothetical protein